MRPSGMPRFEWRIIVHFKKVLAAWRMKVFYATAVACFAGVMTRVDYPLAEQALLGQAPLRNLVLPILALTLSYVGLLCMASRYGRANVEIERLKRERDANQ